MGIFDKLFSKKNDSTESNTSVCEPMTINMSKHTENLENVLVNMSKSGKTNMSNHTARVAIAMDYSGSMRDMFRNGDVQDVITRLLPIALKFDDNGELESWLFSNAYERLKPVTISNYDNYVKEFMLNAKISMGGTEYAPVLRNIVQYYKDKHPSEIPSFIIFITDGDNWDEHETNNIVRELSNYNMFVQFVGIGRDSNFDYLRNLDNLSDRKYDNTGFIAVADMNKMDDECLYTEMLRQYNDWLNNK